MDPRVAIAGAWGPPEAQATLRPSMLLPKQSGAVAVFGSVLDSDWQTEGDPTEATAGNPGGSDDGGLGDDAEESLPPELRKFLGILDRINATPPPGGDLGGDADKDGGGGRNGGGNTAVGGGSYLPGWGDGPPIVPWPGLAPPGLAAPDLPPGVSLPSNPPPGEPVDAVLPPLVVVGGGIVIREGALVGGAIAVGAGVVVGVGIWWAWNSIGVGCLVQCTPQSYVRCTATLGHGDSIVSKEIACNKALPSATDQLLSQGDHCRVAQCQIIG